MISPTAHILAFVEDPGAANFIAPLIPELEKAGCEVSVVAAATGAEQMTRLNARCNQINNAVDVETILNRYSPDLLLVGTSENPDTLGLKLVSAPKLRGVPSVGVVDGPANAAWRFRGQGDSPLACAPQWILVADERTRVAYVSLGHPAHKVIAVGHPHYDHVHEQCSRLKAIGRRHVREHVLPRTGDRLVVTFVAEVSSGLDPSQYKRDSDYTFTGRGTSVKRTDIVLEEVLDALNAVSPRPYTVLRLHPKNTLDEFVAYEREIDYTSKEEPVHELVYASDVIVGMTSHLLLEAAILGRPTLAVLPRPQERDWLSTIDAGLTLCVTNRSSLHTVLAELCAGKGVGTVAESFDPAFARGASVRACRILADLAAGKSIIDSQSRTKEA